MGPPSHSATAARRLMEKESSGQSQGAPPYQMPTSTSTPVSMESAPREHGTARSNSDLGRYSGDTAGHSHPMAPSASAPSGARSGPNAAIPASEQRFAPTRSSSQDLTASSSAADVLQAQRPVTPEMRGDGATPTRGSKPSISGPMNGTPIPTGYKFGAKDEPAAVQDPKKDDRKRFWQGFRGFGGHGELRLVFYFSSSRIRDSTY